MFSGMPESSRRHEASFLQDILTSSRFASSDRDREAINRLSEELRERHPEVPWRQIVAVRHRIVRVYKDSARRLTRGTDESHRAHRKVCSLSDQG